MKGKAVVAASRQSAANSSNDQRRSAETPPRQESALRPAGHGHKAHGQHMHLLQLFALACRAHQFLVSKGPTGIIHPSAFPELFDERWRHFFPEHR